MKHFKSYATAFVFAIALLLTNQSVAQVSNLDQRSPVWWDALEQQLATSLDQSVDQIQDETLQHVIYFASNHSDKVDLTELTPKLLDLYENDQNQARRTMAIVALHAIGNEYSMRRLAELAENEPAGSIRNITMAVLADYFS